MDYRICCLLIANLVKKIPKIVANQIVDNLDRTTSDDAICNSKPCFNNRKSCMLSCTPIPPGSRDKAPYPKEVK